MLQTRLDSSYQHSRQGVQRLHFANFQDQQLAAIVLVAVATIAAPLACLGERLVPAEITFFSN